jgi:putative mRNA 3-end processing factor
MYRSFASGGAGARLPTGMPIDARGGHGTPCATAADTCDHGGPVWCSQAHRSLSITIPIAIGGGVTATFLPPGHVLGQRRSCSKHAGERVDHHWRLQAQPHPTCAPFARYAVRPVHHRGNVRTSGVSSPPIRDEITKLLAARAANPDRCVLVGAYALGSTALIAELRARGWTPIYLHGAMETMCRLYETLGIDLGDSAAWSPAYQGSTGRRNRYPPAVRT